MREAAANWALVSSLDPKLLEWEQLKITRDQVTKWNGKMPDVFAGGGRQGLLLNIHTAKPGKGNSFHPGIQGNGRIGWLSRTVREKGNNLHTKIPGNGRMGWLGALPEQSVRFSCRMHVRGETIAFTAIRLITEIDDR